MVWTLLTAGRAHIGDDDLAVDIVHHNQTASGHLGKVFDNLITVAAAILGDLPDRVGEGLGAVEPRVAHRHDAAAESAGEDLVQEVDRSAARRAGALGRRRRGSRRTIRPRRKGR